MVKIDRGCRLRWLAREYRHGASMFWECRGFLSLSEREIRAMIVDEAARVRALYAIDRAGR